MLAGETSQVGIGIITALPIERLAMHAIIGDLANISAPGDVNNYHVGEFPSRDPAVPHIVAVAVQTADGTRDAAALCTDMARTFPNLRTFVMSGIAAGVPSAARLDGHVALGDIVVATGGVVDYGHVRRVDGSNQVRRVVQKPSAIWIRADHEVMTKEIGGTPPWAPALEQASRTALFRRPADDNLPHVHRGVMGSADLLLRDARYRDTIARDHGILAFEMEGAGLAVGSYLRDLSWFMVRGIADHGDNLTKNDLWHPYAALAAAAYVRALLAECRPFPVPSGQAERPERPRPAESPMRRLEAIVNALLTLPIMLDDYQRRAAFSRLPGHIRESISDSTIARLHVIAVVQACEQFPDGLEALVGALRLSLGADSRFEWIEGVVRTNWSGR